MLISKVTDDAGGDDGRVGMSGDYDQNHEYRTASELFDLMTMNNHFDSHDDSLSTGDLVLLYKNIDIGTKLLNDANGIKINKYVEKKPNQYVETVVYNDEPESDSDLSENYSNEDLHSILMINQERLDFLNDKSFDHLLCHKLGGLEIKSSSLSMEYDKNFLFKDPYIKKQLKHLNVMGSCSEFNNLFSTSLIDYICCKRLEDNYNFYMDNIIIYVQHTLEQLKRISNGDYLTQRTKEKWREVNSKDKERNTKVLATSTSIPLHVERKSDGNATWDDIVHSEVDIRSLSKILEKKIVLEIPKLICGSYRVYSKRCADNLIISCQREEQKIENNKDGKESRVDVVLQLQRSQTGQVMSNINSILVLQTSPALPDLPSRNILPLPYKEENNDNTYSSIKDDSKEPTVTVVELDRETDVHAESAIDISLDFNERERTMDDDSQNANSLIGTNDYPCSDNEKNGSFDVISNQPSSESNIALKDILDHTIFPFPQEATFNVISPDELRITMQKLHMQTSLLEESGEDMPLVTTKKQSPLRVRIKSPYENKSFLLEEKKRRRLLEIRQRREKKKLALSENCKISKHKYAKGAIMPQAASSVTKLSITNKSFYNSIYGQSLNNETKPLKGKCRKEQKSTTDISPLEPNGEEYFESPMLTPEKNSKKYINRSYYLDDTETEVMYTQIKQNDNEDNNMHNPCSGSNSGISNEFNASFNLLTQLIGPSNTSFNEEQTCVAENKPHRSVEIARSVLNTSINPPKAPVAVYTVPENTPTTATNSHDIIEPKKTVTSVECRKSIDRLYELMKKFAKPNNKSDIKLTKSKVAVSIDNSDEAGGRSTIQGSDSGTSVKHHATSSNPSSFSFEKNNIPPIIKSKPIIKKNDPTAVVPKVIISSKLQAAKVEIEKNKKDRRTTSPLKAPPENPLKAISQLLQEFDNVQKSRHKNEVRPARRTETAPIDGKNISRQGSFRRRSRIDQHNMKDNEKGKNVTPNASPREKRYKPLPPMELARIPHQQVFTEDRGSKKKIADIIDEAKEARGEAVRGPSKLTSRLNSLAQPKRSYVQAHSEEYQNKYGRNIVSDRLQRLAAAPSPVIERNVVSANSRNRTRRYGGDSTSMASVKQPASTVPQLEKYTKVRRSASSSPNRKYPRHVPVGINSSGPISDAAMQSNEAINKMVAVESYVKSHYGRSCGTSPSSEVLLSGHKSRVPLIPTDIELASLGSSPAADEATEIGNKLHRMIDSMLTNASPLTALTECDRETNSKVSKNTDFYDLSQDPRCESDYHINILEDKDLHTAVENIETIKNNSNVSIDRSVSQLDIHVNSRAEMEKLESALYSQISGAFQKRLRIKNLTLTPKHSMQQVFLVQSGDAGSLVVKSTVSNIKANKRSMDSLHEMKVMPVLSNSHLDWNFAQIPMQIATVGYAFPDIKSAVSRTRVKLLEVSSVASSDEDACSYTGKSDKVSQCFKGIHQGPLYDTSSQVDAAGQSVSLTGVMCLNCESLYDKQRYHDIQVENDRSIKTSTQTSISINYNKDDGANGDAQTAKIPNHSSDEGFLKAVNDANALENPMNGAEIIEKADSVIEEVNGGTKFENGDPGEKATDSSELTPSSVNVDFTTSLDMLVGLLNEIQKITCQNQMAAANNNQNCADLEKILNDAANLEKSKEDITGHLISMTSLNELRQLASNTSIYSLSEEDKAAESISIQPEVKDISGSTYSVNNRSNVTQADNLKQQVDENVATEATKPIRVDKEVSANLYESEYVNNFTSVSSSLMPLMINRSANFTNSIIGVISEPSAHSMIKVSDYQTIYSNRLFNTQSTLKIIELAPVDGNTESILIPRDKTDLNLDEKTFPSIRNAEDLTIERSLIVRSEIGKYCVNKIDLDPMLKFKRDILVTLYSILVLTVFAALSFPELIFYEH